MRAAQHERRLLDQRQPIFNSVREGGASGRQELPDAHHPVLGRVREQRERLAAEIADPAEHLMANPPLVGVDSGADQCQRPYTCGKSDGELGDDLTPQRVSDERRPLELERVHAPSK
jgi:hypothetical protein